MQTDEDLLCRKLLLSGEGMCHCLMSWHEKIFPCTPKNPSVKSRVAGQGEHGGGTSTGTAPSQCCPRFFSKGAASHPAKLYVDFAIETSFHQRLLNRQKNRFQL